MRRVVLVGMMASGKSSVGRLLADRLGWSFSDVDAEITRRVGMSVPEIFGSLGEPYFRRIEHETATEIMQRDHVVIASGGGWAAVEGRLEALPEGSWTVWLSVTAEEAVRRASARPDRRPLLTTGDVLGVARRLLSERTPFYGRADSKVDTDGLSVEDVSSRVLAIAAGKSP